MSRGICSCNWWSTNIGIFSFTHGQLPICFNSPPLVFLRHFNQMKSTLLYFDKRSFSRKSLTPSSHRFNTKPESNLPHADAAPIKWRLSFDCPILIGGALWRKVPQTQKWIHLYRSSGYLPPKGSNIDTMSPPFLFALSEHEICVCNKAPHGNTGGLRYALQVSYRNCQIAVLQYRSTQGALSSHAAFGPCFITLLFSGLFNLSFCNYSSSSGACPSCAGHLHSVNSILVKMARKEEFSGLQA